MKRVLTAIILIPLVLLVLFKAPMWLFTLVVGAVAMGAAWEYLRLIDIYAGKASKFVPMALVAFIFVASALTKVSFPTLSQVPHAHWLTLIPALMALSPLLIVALAMSHADLKIGFIHGAMSAFIFPYIVWSLMTLTAIRFSPNGIALMLFLFVAVWAGDVFAYYVGKAVGRHKLAPRISPGKTWEGAIASLISSVLCAHVVFVHQGDITLWIEGFPTLYPPRLTPFEMKVTGIILAFVVNIAAQVGDLVESMIKRGAGAKDSGTLLPGHGGVLDRIDALLFAAPVVFFYTILNPAWTFYTPLNK